MSLGGLADFGSKLVHVDDAVEDDDVPQALRRFSTSSPTKIASAVGSHGSEICGSTSMSVMPSSLRAVSIFMRTMKLLPKPGASRS